MVINGWMRIFPPVASSVSLKYPPVLIRVEFAVLHSHVRVMIVKDSIRSSWIVVILSSQADCADHAVYAGFTFVSFNSIRAVREESELLIN